MKTIYDYILSDARLAHDGIPGSVPSTVSGIVTENLEPGGVFDLPEGSGFGTVFFGDDEGYITFSNNDTGIIEYNDLRNVLLTDTASRFCVFKHEITVRVQNNTDKAVEIKISYSGLLPNYTPQGAGSLAGLLDDSEHRTVTDAQIAQWDSHIDGVDYEPVDAALKDQPDGYVSLGADGRIAEERASLTSFYSAGMLSPSPVLTDNGDGTVSLPDGKCVMYDNTIGAGQPKQRTLAAKFNIVVPMGISFIVAKDVNGQAEYVLLQDNSSINESNVLPVHSLHRDTEGIDSLDWDSMAEGLPNKIHARLVKTDRFRREPGGLVIGTENLTVTNTAGVIWIGAHRVYLLDYDSSADPLHVYKYDGVDWIHSDHDGLNNTSTATALLADGKYNISWIYRYIGNSSKVVVILDESEYDTVADAQIKTAPDHIPEEIISQCIFLGKITIQKDSIEPLIEQLTNTSFASSTPSSHKDLSGVDGGQWHLTQLEHARIIDWDTAKTHADSLHAPADAEANIRSDWSVTDPESSAFIQNKPDVGGNLTLQQVTGFGAETTDFVSFLGGITSVDPAVSNSERFGYDALKSNTGYRNTAFGYNVLPNNVGGTDNTVVGSSSLVSNIDGNYNVGIGSYALTYSRSSENVGVGYETLTQNASEGKNTAIGYQAGKKQTGPRNTFLGNHAGYTDSNTYRFNTTLLGYNAQATEVNQVVLGDDQVSEIRTYGTLKSLNASPLWSGTATDGQVLTADGSGGASWVSGGAGSTPTLQDVTTEGATTDVYTLFTGGVGSSSGNTTKYGYQAANTNTSGTNYVAMGYQAAFSNSSGRYWTAIGSLAGRSNIGLNEWVALGYVSGYSNTNGSQWTSLGAQAAYSNTTGDKWIALGYQSGRHLADGFTAATNFNNSIYVGSMTKVSANSVTNENVFGNNAIGVGSNTVSLGDLNITEVSTYGSFNSSHTSPLGSAPSGANATVGYVLTADGSGGSNWAEASGGGETPTLQEVTDAGATTIADISILGEIRTTSNNVERFGLGALRNTTGDWNTAFGNTASFANTTGVNNSAFGYQSLRSNQAGGENSAFGRRALYNSTSSFGSAFGSNALINQTSGTGNSAFGSGSLAGMTNGSQNTGIGANSGNNVNSSNCTFIGYNAGSAAAPTFFSNSTAIGFDSVLSSNNQIAIGDGNVTEIVTAASLNSSNTSPLGSAPSGTNAAVGTVLTADGSGGSSWQDGGGGASTLQEVTEIGATTDQDVSFSGSISATKGSSESEYFGAYALINEDNSGTRFNSAFGRLALYEMTTGQSNSGFGNGAGQRTTTGSNNFFGGRNSGSRNITGSNNFFGGISAASLNDTASPAILMDNSVYIGYDVRAGASSATTGITNEIVIGYNAYGKGSNTINLGNTSISDTYLNGAVHVGSNWSVTQNGTDLEFSHDGVRKMTLKSDGTILAKNFQLDNTI